MQKQSKNEIKINPLSMSQLLYEDSHFEQILSVIVKFIQKDAEERKSYFNPRPYFRLFVNWILDLTAPDPALDGLNFQVSSIRDLCVAHVHS